jgi:hypothetical protein
MDPKQHEIGSPDMAKFRSMVALLQANKKNGDDIICVRE